MGRSTQHTGRDQRRNSTDRRTEAYPDSKRVLDEWHTSRYQGLSQTRTLRLVRPHAQVPEIRVRIARASPVRTRASEKSGEEDAARSHVAYQSRTALKIRKTREGRTHRIGAVASRKTRSLRSTTGDPFAQTCRTPSLCPGALSCTYIVTLVYLHARSSFSLLCTPISGLVTRGTYAPRVKLKRPRPSDVP